MIFDHFLHYAHHALTYQTDIGDPWSKVNIVEDGSPRIAFGSYNVYGQKMRRPDGELGNLGRIGGKASRQTQANLMLEEFNRHKVSDTYQ